MRFLRDSESTVTARTSTIPVIMKMLPESMAFLLKSGRHEELRGIVARLEPELGAAEGEPEPLEGGITNRNFRIRLNKTD